MFQSSSIWVLVKQRFGIRSSASVSEINTWVASPHGSIFALRTPLSQQCRPPKARKQEAQAVVHHKQDGRRLWGSRTVVVPTNQAAKPQSDRLTQDCRTTRNTRWNNGFVNPVTRNHGGIGRLDDCEASKEERVAPVRGARASNHESYSWIDVDAHSNCKGTLDGDSVAHDVLVGLSRLWGASLLSTSTIYTGFCPNRNRFLELNTAHGEAQ